MNTPGATCQWSEEGVDGAMRGREEEGLWTCLCDLDLVL